MVMVMDTDMGAATAMDTDMAMGADMAMDTDIAMGANMGADTTEPSTSDCYIAIVFILYLYDQCLSDSTVCRIFVQIIIKAPTILHKLLDSRLELVGNTLFLVHGIIQPKSSVHKKLSSSSA